MCICNHLSLSYSKTITADDAVIMESSKLQVLIPTVLMRKDLRAKLHQTIHRAAVGVSLNLESKANIKEDLEEKD